MRRPRRHVNPMMKLLETLLVPDSDAQCACFNVGLHGNPLDLNNPCLPCL